MLGASTDSAEITDGEGAGGRGFQSEAARAFAAVRAALGNLVAAVPGTIRRPTDLQKALGVDYKICWQVFNVVRATDSLAAAKHAPSPSGVKRLLTAARRAGVGGEVIDAVRSAAEQLGDVVESHAGDRQAFDAMVSAVSDDEDAAAVDLQHRRAAYRALSHIWGVQVQTYLLSMFVRPSASANGTDECVLNVKHGVRRLRPNVPAVVHGYRHHSSTEVTRSPSRRPLDPDAAARYGAPILPEFCSQPLPAFNTIPYANGWTYHEVSGESIGRRSAVDFAFGGIARDVPFSLDTDGRRLFRSSATMQTSTGLLVSDLLVHRPSYGAVTPELMIFRNTPGDESPEVSRQAQQLPVWEKVTALGTATTVAQTPDTLSYPTMLRAACDALGWDLGEFDLYRVQVQYPVLGSVVRLQFYMPG